MSKRKELETTDVEETKHYNSDASDSDLDTERQREEVQATERQREEVQATERQREEVQATERPLKRARVVPLGRIILYTHNIRTLKVLDMSTTSDTIDSFFYAFPPNGGSYALKILRFGTSVWRLQDLEEKLGPVLDTMPDLTLLDMGCIRGHPDPTVVDSQKNPLRAFNFVSAYPQRLTRLPYKQLHRIRTVHLPFTYVWEEVFPCVTVGSKIEALYFCVPMALSFEPHDERMSDGFYSFPHIYCRVQNCQNCTSPKYGEYHNKIRNPIPHYSWRGFELFQTLVANPDTCITYLQVDYVDPETHASPRGSEAQCFRTMLWQTTLASNTRQGLVYTESLRQMCRWLDARRRGKAPPLPTIPDEDPEDDEDDLVANPEGAMDPAPLQGCYKDDPSDEYNGELAALEKKARQRGCLCYEGGPVPIPRARSIYPHPGCGVYRDGVEWLCEASESEAEG
jgi:hypothetical protein